MSFKLTPGNVQDSRLVESLTQNLRGWLFGDKGYLGQDLKDSLLKRGLHLITRVRKNMKKVSMSTLQRAYLNKRGMIETIIDQLKALCHIQHTRHRSPTNFVVNVLGGLFAYILRPKKVSVRFNQLNNLNNCLNNLTLLTSS